MSVRIGCDRTHCSESYVEGSTELHGWHRVESMDPEDDREFHFCSVDHLIQQLAGFQVPDNVEAG